MYLDYFQKKVESHGLLVPQSVHVDCDSLILVKYASNKFPIRPLLFPVHRRVLKMSLHRKILLLPLLMHTVERTHLASH